MINVKPYLERLDRLREYMNEVIDGRVNQIVIDYEWLPNLTVDAMMEIFYETGWLVNSSPEYYMRPVARLITFEEYLQYINNQ